MYLFVGTFWFFFAFSYFVLYLDAKRIEQLVFSLIWLVLGIIMSAISFRLKAKDKELGEKGALLFR